MSVRFVFFDPQLLIPHFGLFHFRMTFLFFISDFQTSMLQLQALLVGSAAWAFFFGPVSLQRPWAHGPIAATTNYFLDSLHSLQTDARCSYLKTVRHTHSVGPLRAPHDLHPLAERRMRSTLFPTAAHLI